MDKYLTAYLHLGDKFMPKSFTALPRMGEFVDTGPFGKLVVVRLEHDQEGDPHLYLEAGTGETPAPSA